MTDSRAVARHANDGWSFWLATMGRVAPPGRHGRAERRYVPKVGKTLSSARGHYFMQARAKTDEFGHYLYVCARMNRS